MFKNKLIFLFFISFFTTEYFAQEKLSAKEIFEKSIEVTRPAGTEAVSQMTIFDEKGRTRERRLYQLSKLTNNGNTEKKLIRFLSPADVKGTGFLTYDYKIKDDDKWLYMPALRKTRRIISSENAKSFMGSEFSYADMTPLKVDDFKFTNLGIENIKGVQCYKIEILPLDDEIADENGFTKKISFFDIKYHVLRKAVYYDLDGSLHKELMILKVTEVDPVNHKFRFSHMEMINVQNKRKSILTVDKIKLLPKVKDSYFTTRYLEK